jgi:hypothetical protein
MNSVDKALATQLANIEKRSGKSLAELTALLAASGLSKHGEQVAYLKETMGLGHGDANTLAHYAKQSAAPAAAENTDPLDAIYVGAKAPLRALHEALLARIANLGEFEQAPKKTYISLRRSKQFAMVGPATAKEIDIGINSKSLTGGARLKALPPGGMCQFKVRLSSPSEIDAELLGWLDEAFRAA